MTGAETCELVLALDALGDRERAAAVARRHAAPAARGRLLLDRLRLPGRAYWPVEQTTYTAAVLLALDALTRGTGGSGVFRGDGLPAVHELALTCGCGASGGAAEGVAGVARRAP